ncbi:hypothetical protein GCM10017673_54460 [Streptosporangium violaceochromogenes]|nr:hypothetical protein GCM10017673_54460 [Streptosporangium violaceochromogenes]
MSPGTLEVPFAPVGTVVGGVLYPVGAGAGELEVLRMTGEERAEGVRRGPLPQRGSPSGNLANTR